MIYEAEDDDVGDDTLWIINSRVVSLRWKKKNITFCHHRHEPINDSTAGAQTLRVSNKENGPLPTTWIQCKFMGASDCKCSRNHSRFVPDGVADFSDVPPKHLLQLITVAPLTLWTWKRRDPHFPLISPPLFYASTCPTVRMVTLWFELDVSVFVIAR
jgi:hypothetical protein